MSKQIKQLWQWRSQQNSSYLTCSLLESWQHGFFGQDSDPQKPDALVKLWQPEVTAYRVKQVHGKQIMAPQEIATVLAHQEYAEADGVISDHSNQSVWVASADCTPILIGDVATGQVSAVHAGWRGTAQKIAAQAIQRLMDCGSSLVNLRIAIGPAISGAMYQVDVPVAIEVLQTIIPDLSCQDEIALLERMQQFEPAPISEDVIPGKVRLDVPRVNQIQLNQLGIADHHIAIAPWCTYTDHESFFSYRRTGLKKVQWSGIISR